MGSVVLFCCADIVSNHDQWYRSHLKVIGEVLGVANDGLLRKQLSRVFSAKTTESSGIEADQILSES